MKDISIIAATFYGNRGAEAMLCTTMAELQKNSEDTLRFNVFSYYPERDATLIADPLISVYSSTPAYLVFILFPFSIIYRFSAVFGLRLIKRMLPKSVHALASSDMLICLAGVSFVEGRSKFLPFNIATILPAMVLGVPVIKFSQALGPFKGKLNCLLARFFLGRCSYIFTRGENTHSHVKRLLSNKKNYARADDIAFLFKPEYCLSTPTNDLIETLSKLQDKRNTGQIVVGVCPSIVVAKRAQKTGWDYSQSIADLIVELAERGHEIALYPNATRGEDMDKTHNNDLPLLEDITRKLPAKSLRNVTKFSGSLNAAQIHTIIRACDIHVLSRFHAMVASLNSAIPVLVIGWSHKYLEVMERFDQKDMVIDYQQGGKDEVMILVDRLIEERSQRAVSIAENLTAVRTLSFRQIEYAVTRLRTGL